MKYSDWKKAVNLLTSVENIRNINSSGMRRFLVDLYLLALRAPYNIAVWFDSVEEDELATRQNRWMEILNSSEDFISGPISGQSAKRVMADLGGLIRACDYLLRKEAIDFGPVADSSDWEIGEWYLVPRKSIPHWREAKVAQSIRRRGMVFHRLVPKEIGGLNVELIPFATLSDDSRNCRVAAAAAILPHLEVDFTPANGDRFNAINTNEQMHRKVVVEQLQAGAEEGCFAIVWPELSVPGDLRNHIEAHLLNNYGTGAAIAFPDIVVPGSWHEFEGGKFRNISRVYDRFGVERAAHSKIVPYFDERRGDENIESGDRLSIFVTDDFLVGFAICKDFCGFSNPPLPYLELNVDFIIVPSMGDGKTLSAHRKVADFLKVQNGGRAFIVQQHMNPTEGECAGYVVPPEAKREDEPVAVLHDGRIRVFNRH